MVPLLKKVTIKYATIMTLNKKKLNFAQIILRISSHRIKENWNAVQA